MNRSLAILAILAIVWSGLDPCRAAAQGIPGIPTPPRPGVNPQTAAQGSDSSRRDSALVQWSPPDSVMQALMSRKDFTVTRYQGLDATFDAQQRALALEAPRAGKAAVQRETQTFVSDSAIFYNDSTRRVSLGHHYVVSDPSSGQADVVGYGLATYDMRERFARVPNGASQMKMGETWFFTWQKAAIAGDTSNNKAQTLYAQGGTLTSCNDSVPDYKFVWSQAKRTTSNTIVASPAVLYIKDVPVMWLPFIFTDARNGRHSGILTPRFGLSDVVRNSSGYRRHVENAGYYWSINDYMDASASLDWRSSAAATAEDPGWLRLNSEFNYSWLDRMLNGRVGTSYTTQSDGSTNLGVSWGHSEQFTKDSRLTTNVNYVTNTVVQRTSGPAAFNPYAALATIRSDANYTQRFGPVNMTVGGSRLQYTGRQEIDETVPTLNLTSTPISLAGDALVWTPGFSYTATQNLHIDQQTAFSYQYFDSLGRRDSTLLRKNAYNSSMSFDTPLRIFGYDLRNSFVVAQQRNDFPDQFTLIDPQTGDSLASRVFASTYSTSVDWTPTFAIPSIGQNRFNFGPSISFANVDPGPFWIKTQLTNGQFVHQSKRPTFGVSAAPAIFGFFRGFGPFQEFRHTLSPTVSYGYAPPASVSDAYLHATNRSQAHYLGNLASNQVSVGLNQTVEAKIRNPADTNPDHAKKIKVLSLQFSPFAYDFERARATHRKIAGLTTQDFTYQLSSPDLLPGFSLSSSYSLFQGSTLSDTAIFKPYRESVSASLSIGPNDNPFVVFTRLFGKAVPEAQKSPEPGSDQPGSNPSGSAFTKEMAAQPIAGTSSSGAQFVPSPSSGWRASFSLTSSTPRPPVGGNIVDLDPNAQCRALAVETNNPLVYQECVNEQRLNPTTVTPPPQTISGGVGYRVPGQTFLGSSINFNLTPKWSAMWTTQYDFVLHQFASHVVSLERDLHDWRALFGFTQSPNGNFAFMFTIALKAEPDLKFDYNRATVRSGQAF